LSELDRIEKQILEMKNFSDEELSKLRFAILHLIWYLKSARARNHGKRKFRLKERRGE